MTKFPTQSLASIADLPLEERHAIVLSWLRTLTDFYERAATQRDALVAALEQANSILWMAEKYAEGGGSRSPEMEDYTTATTAIHAALTLAGVRDEPR